MKTSHTCVLGDSRKMVEVKDSSVQLVVTSPPYWQLKDYGAKAQIGFNTSYEDYINNLNLVWRECSRVLSPGCRMLVNIGDQFARATYYGRYKVIPIRTEIIRFCETIGFDYMGAIIWQKKTTMNTTGGATVMGSYPFPRNGIVEIDYEFILIFKKPGKTLPASAEIKTQSKISKEKWKTYFSGHWYFGGAHQNSHIAMFPVELPKRAIEMFTFVSETVLDPFLGSGSTSLAAIQTGRNSIGYEINREFLDTIKDKTGINHPDLFDEINFKFLEQKPAQVNWQQEIQTLPYQFHDPIIIAKKADHNEQTFGSKISVADSKAGISRETYFSVKAILDTNMIKLNDGRTVRLLGVKPLENRVAAARTFLEKKILKRRVYLRMDSVTADEGGNILAYLYLKNKTFINAHLLKLGLAEIDQSFPFKHLSKFQKFTLQQS